MTDQLLDLSGRQAALRVRLPDGEVYPMAVGDEMGVGQLHRIAAEYDKAKRLMAIENPAIDDAEEMLSVLIDVCCQILPTAPREVIGQLSLPRMERLIEGFKDASPAKRPAEATASTRE